MSGYLYGVDDSLLHLNGNCSCNYTPGLWRLLDMGDIASLIAPHPLLVQSCEEDHLNGSRGLKNVDEQLEMACGTRCVRVDTIWAWHILSRISNGSIRTLRKAPVHSPSACCE